MWRAAADLIIYLELVIGNLVWSYTLEYAKNTTALFSVFIFFLYFVVYFTGRGGGLIAISIWHTFTSLVVRPLIFFEEMKVNYVL